MGSLTLPSTIYQSEFRRRDLKDGVSGFWWECRFGGPNATAVWF
ncbi:unnamed protein product, partial [Vitis vinifera]